MTPSTLHWRTHLIFPRFDGLIEKRDDHLLIRTPHNPTYYWGNFLLYPSPPAQGDFERWRSAFHREIRAPQPASRHEAYGFEGQPDDRGVAPFLAAGFELLTSVTLRLRPDRLRTSPKGSGSAALRILRTGEEIASAVDLQVAGDMDGHEAAGYRLFRQRQMARYMAMSDAGLGHWFGLLEGGDAAPTLVADCGIFRDGDLGRYQHVTTHPAHRRQGHCGTLIHESARHAFENMGINELVIVADPHDVAIRIYESVGFERVESGCELQLRD